MNIYQSIAAIMTDVDAIGKDRKNAQQGFSFRGIDDVYNSIHPILAKHGVFTVPEVLENTSEELTTKSGGVMIHRVMKIKYTFFAADGSSVFAIVIGEAMDTGDKSANKCMSIAHKYAFFQVLSIPTLDDSDPDAVTPPASVKNAPLDPRIAQIKTVLMDYINTGLLSPAGTAQCQNAIDNVFEIGLLERVLAKAKAAHDAKQEQA
jgi:hypothetical protein